MLYFFLHIDIVTKATAYFFSSDTESAIFVFLFLTLFLNIFLV